MATSLSSLPEEMLTKIFSFLSSGNILNLSTVCSKFNAASKDPSLWRRCEIALDFEKELNIPSFCSFFCKFPYLQELNLTLCSQNFDASLENLLNNLFENLPQLYYFETDINLTNIVLPPSLKYLSGLISQDYDEGKPFPFLERCPNIERLSLFDNYLPLTLKSLLPTLLKYQQTLTAIYLNLCNFDENWISLLANCANLKTVGIDIMSIDLNLGYLFDNSLSSRLEVMHLQSIYQLNDTRNLKFHEMKHLTVKDTSLEECQILINRMPKLETFYYESHYCSIDISDLYNFIRSLNFLNSLMVYTDNLSEDELTDMNQQLNEGNSEDKLWNITYHSHKESNFDSLLDYLNWGLLSKVPEVLVGRKPGRHLSIIRDFYDSD